VLANNISAQDFYEELEGKGSKVCGYKNYKFYYDVENIDYSGAYILSSSEEQMHENLMNARFQRKKF
jgi:hypothetical protein